MVSRSGRRSGGRTEHQIGQRNDRRKAMAPIDAEAMETKADVGREYGPAAAV